MAATNLPEDWGTWKRDIERQLRELRDRVGNVSGFIGEGGVTVGAGGTLRVEDATQHPIFVVQGTHLFTFWDYLNNVVLSADPAGGLAEPWMSVPLYPTFIPNTLAASGGDSSWTTPDSTTEHTMWRGRLAQVTHPKLIVDGDWGYASGGPGTATYRLKVNGVTIGTWTATGVETTNHVYDNLAFLHTQNLDVVITLQCSTNAGTAQVRCAPYGLSQRQS